MANPARLEALVALDLVHSTRDAPKVPYFSHRSGPYPKDGMMSSRFRRSSRLQHAMASSWTSFYIHLFGIYRARQASILTFTAGCLARVHTC